MSGLVDDVVVSAAEYDGCERQHGAHQDHVVHVGTRHLYVPAAAT